MEIKWYVTYEYFMDGSLKKTNLVTGETRYYPAPSDELDEITPEE